MVVILSADLLSQIQKESEEFYRKNNKKLIGLSFEVEKLGLPVKSTNPNNGNTTMNVLISGANYLGMSHGEEINTKADLGKKLKESRKVAAVNTEKARENYASRMRQRLADVTKSLGLDVLNREILGSKTK